MMKAGTLLLCLCTLMLSSCSDLSSEFLINTPKADDTVVLHQNQDNVRFDVSSKSGIGRTTITLEKGEWPTDITVRAHLKGLEGFNLTIGSEQVDQSKIEINAFTQSGEPFEGKYLLDQAGYYEINIPNALLIGHKSMDIQWIDFYR